MGSPGHLWLCVPVSQPGGVIRGAEDKEWGRASFPTPPRRESGGWQKGQREPANCPFWGPCRGDKTVNHGYLQIEPEVTSQDPQVTQVHSQSPCCFREVGWELQDTGSPEDRRVP